MRSCAYCGAENADSSTYCTLCLAKMDAAVGSVGSEGAAESPPWDAGRGRQRVPGLEVQREASSGQQPHTYVSPGDYRALMQERAGDEVRAAGGELAYRRPAQAAPLPSYRRRSSLDISLMLLTYSLLTFIALFVARVVVGTLLLGAAFGGSEAGFSFGLALYFAVDAGALLLGGYFLVVRLMPPGKGWLYGLGCAACVVFGWQLLASLAMALLLTGRVYLPLFTLVGLMFTLFLELPMGALGGWLAEKRYIG